MQKEIILILILKNFKYKIIENISKRNVYENS